MKSELRYAAKIVLLGGYDEQTRNAVVETMESSATRISDLERKLAVAKEALEKIANLNQWGDDKWEEIGMEPYHRKYARAALKEIEK